MQKVINVAQTGTEPEQDQIAGGVNSPEWRQQLASMGGRALAERMQERRESAASALPPLVEPSDALDRLERISRLAIAGVLPGAQASAASRAVEAWLNAQRLAVSLQRVRALEKRIVELEAELTRTRARGTS